MRTGATQKVPTATPLVTVTIGADSYDTTDRLVRVITDEQVWGGRYFIELDNSDEALNSKDYKGDTLTLNFGFASEAGSDLVPLLVQSQELSSDPGKLRLRLNCIDKLTELSLRVTTIGTLYYNQSWQNPNSEDYLENLPEEALAGWDKTILTIVQELAALLGLSVQVDAGHDDDIVNEEKPALAVTNARTGIQQALAMTKLFPVLKGSTIHLIQPDLEGVVYSYNVGNLFHNNTHEVSVTIPNRVFAWGRDSDDNWIAGQADDTTSQGKVGIIPTSVFFHPPNAPVGVSTTEAKLDNVAAGILSQIQGMGNQGSLVAPMHCAQELLDKVSVVDDRYSPAKTITGIVHRIQRRYEAGIYQITIQLGGVVSGHTPSEGEPIPMVTELGFQTPQIPIQPWRIPAAIQGFQHDIHFVADSWDTVSWGTGGTIKFYDGTTQNITGTGSPYTIPDGVVRYIYFDLNDATPSTLKVTDNYLNVMSTKTGVVCMIQRGSDETVKATVIPSYGKEPLITADVIYLTGLLDKLPDGTYGKVLSTCLSAGRIVLDEVIGDLDDLDDIDDGSTYGKVRRTDISAGHIKLYVDQNLDEQGIEIVSSTDTYRIKIDSNYIAGYRGSTKTFYIRASDGRAYCGGGDVILDEDGITVKGRPIYLNTPSGGSGGRIGYDSETVLYIDVPSDDYIWLEAPGSNAYIVIEAANITLKGGIADDLYPNAHEIHACGFSNKAWSQVVGEYVYSDDGNIYSYQKHDDIALLRGLKTKKNKKGRDTLDALSLPQELVIRNDQGQNYVNLGGLHGLSLGIMKALLARIETLEARIDALIS